MALTMVHLLAADLWARNHPEYHDSPDFFYGVISPDAIHIRDGGDKSHKDEIHLYNWRTPRPERVLEYWQAHSDPFDIGYGVHVLTDCQWVQRYTQRLPGIMRPNGLLNIDIYYNDTFVTDFRLYKTRPRLEAILHMTESADTPQAHPLLTAYELSEWRKRIVKAYREPCPYDKPVRFIDEAYVDAFVADCIPLIENTHVKRLITTGRML